MVECRGTNEGVLALFRMEIRVSRFEKVTLELRAKV